MNRSHGFKNIKNIPITLLKDYLDRYRKINEIDLSMMDTDEISPAFRKYLYKLGKYYDARDIKRFRPPKRYTFLLAFIEEVRRVLADHIIQMHDQYISNICRECKNIHEAQLRQFKIRNEKAIDCIEKLVDYLLEQEESAVLNLQDIYNQTSEKNSIKNARNDMREYKIVSKYGYAKLLQNRYSSMRRYFPEFLNLPIKAEKDCAELLQAIQQIKTLEKGQNSLSTDENCPEIIDRKLHSALYNESGEIKRNLWEIGLAIAIRDNFRSGNIFLPQSNKHVSFWDLVYKEEQWEK